MQQKTDALPGKDTVMLEELPTEQKPQGSSIHGSLRYRATTRVPVRYSRALKFQDHTHSLLPRPKDQIFEQFLLREFRKARLHRLTLSSDKHRPSYHLDG